MKASMPLLILIGLPAWALSGCATEMVEPVHIAQPPPPDTNVYFYPTHDHQNVSAEQQSRDKYECNTWAVQQSGFDPSLPSVPPHQRIRAIAGGPPPGTEVGTGAITGAIVGAEVSNPWRTGHGALLGAAAGAALGGIVEAERNENSNRLQAQASADTNAAQAAAMEQQASKFRRAVSACLEARGYSVK